MNEQQFWQLIEASRKETDVDACGDFNQTQQLNYLENALRRLGNDELIGWEKVFHHLMNLSYRWDLMRIAELIEGGCGDDGFMDFRGWLISQGKAVFDRTLRDPDSLVDVAHRGRAGMCFFPDIAFIASRLYEERTGIDEMPTDGFDSIPTKPLGEFLETGPVKLEKRFPRLWRRFGKDSRKQ